MPKNYKPWKNYQEKPSQVSKQEQQMQVKEATIDLEQGAAKTEVPEDTTKVVKLDKGSSALVTHSISKKKIG
jgi:hypothetical protein